MQSRKRKGNNHCVQLFLLPAQLQTLLRAFKRMKQLSTHQHLKIATYFYTHWKCQLHNRVQLCDPMGCSLPGSSVHGILQARILQWFAISSSRGSSKPGIEPRFPALQADLHCLSHQGSLFGLNSFFLFSDICSYQLGHSICWCTIVHVTLIIL